MTSPAMPAVATPVPVRVGLVDSGVDDGHPALAGTACGTGVARPRVPDAHGTAVASLLAGRAVTVRPPAPTLSAADVYCGKAPAARARRRPGIGMAVARAGRRGQHQPGRTAEPTARTRRGGHAARGPCWSPRSATTGPPPHRSIPRRMPAWSAWRGQRARRVAAGGRARPAGRFRRARRRPARGRDRRPLARVRGTSFAAPPLVARLAALHMPSPGAAGVAAALSALDRDAVLPPGADALAYGHGVVGLRLPLTRAPGT